MPESKDPYAAHLVHAVSGNFLENAKPSPESSGELWGSRSPKGHRILAQDVSPWVSDEMKAFRLPEPPPGSQRAHPTS